eukprot:Hpha_TRINITY_DN509_c0_g1::TRINITY_DN509_c0_g1_i1::g.171841::m.171841
MRKGQVQIMSKDRSIDRMMEVIWKLREQSHPAYLNVMNGPKWDPSPQTPREAVFDPKRPLPFFVLLGAVSTMYEQNRAIRTRGREIELENRCLKSAILLLQRETEELRESCGELQSDTDSIQAKIVKMEEGLSILETVTASDDPLEDSLTLACSRSRSFRGLGDSRSSLGNSRRGGPPAAG